MSVPAIPLDAHVVQALSGVSTATLTTVLLKHGLRNVWLRGTRPLAPQPAAADRPRLHAALRAGARRPGHARVVGLADLHPRGDRGDARRLHCGGRRDGHHRRRHLRRHPVRAHAPARRRRAGHRRRGARRRRRARHRAAGVVPGHGRAAVGGRAHLRRLAGADRLRRRRGVSQRRDQRRPGRRGADSRRRCSTRWSPPRWSRSGSKAGS